MTLTSKCDAVTELSELRGNFLRISGISFLFDSFVSLSRRVSLHALPSPRLQKLSSLPFRHGAGVQARTERRGPGWNLSASTGLYP